VTKNLTKKAVEMLLKGATLSENPCPYCKGVRVMKDGLAFCVNCGREPEKRSELDVATNSSSNSSKSSLEILEKKLKLLSEDLYGESDHEKQQEILRSINSLIEIIDKMKKK